MELCAIDWNLASKFVPLVTPIVSVFLAFFVYFVWHKQKRKEVIANEAKSLMVDLFKLNEHIQDIFTCNFKNNEKFEEGFYEYKKLAYTVKSKLFFIRNNLKISYKSKDNIETLNAFIGALELANDILEKQINTTFDKLEFKKILNETFTNQVSVNGHVANEVYNNFHNGISHVLELLNSLAIYE